MKTLHTQHGYNVSDKYKALNTGLLLENIQTKTGYDLISYKEHKVLKAHKDGYQKHLAILESKAPITINGEELKPRLVLVNSYDKSTSLKVYIGFLRMACLNGIVAGDFFNTFKARHLECNADTIANYFNNLDQIILESTFSIENMMGKTLPYSQYEKLALDTFLNLHPKWLETVEKRRNVSQEYAKMMLTGHLLQCRRDEDKELNNWNVFNRIQENVIERPIRVPFARKVNAPSKLIETQATLYNALQ